MTIEIVDFPMNSMVIFHCYVSSPEGNSYIEKYRTLMNLVDYYLPGNVFLNVVETWVLKVFFFF